MRVIGKLALCIEDIDLRLVAWNYREDENTRCAVPRGGNANVLLPWQVLPLYDTVLKVLNGNDDNAGGGWERCPRLVKKLFLTWRDLELYLAAWQ